MVGRLGKSLHKMFDFCHEGYLNVIITDFTVLNSPFPMAQ